MDYTKMWLLIFLGAGLYHTILLIIHRTWEDGYLQGKAAMLKQAQEYIAFRLKEKY